MGLIFDTCIFIHAEKQGEDLDFERWAARYDEVYITAITVSELLVGVHRANSEARRVQRSAFVEMIISSFPALNFTPEIARIHAELYAHLGQQGNRIGAHDLLIAATAIAQGHAVLTANSHEFKRIPGLVVLTP